MANHQQHSFRYSNLRVTVKHETNERLVNEMNFNSKKNSYPTTIYYNSNHRQKQYFPRPSPSRSQNYSYQQVQPLRPLMEIKDNYDFSSHLKTMNHPTFKQRKPKQRDQYQNLKTELDWDHAFDLDQIDLYSPQNDIDNDSLTSINSISDNSFSFV